MALFNFMPGETGGSPDPLNGLLSGNDPLLNIGLGILANNQGHYGRFGPALGLGAQQGIQNTLQQRHQQQLQQIQALQMQKMQRDADQEARQRQAEDALSKAFTGAYTPGDSTPNMGFMDANNQAMQGTNPLTPGNPTDVTNPSVTPQQNYQWNAQPGSFNTQTLLQNVMSDNSIPGATKFAYMQGLKKDNTPIKVGKGESLVNPQTFQPVFTAPEEAKYTFAPNGQIVDLSKPDTTQNYAKPDLPSAVQEYQFAQGQGYRGSFNDFLISQKRAGASNVNIDMKQQGEEAKTVGKYFGDQYADIQKAGLAATGKINKVNRLNQLLQGVDTGKFTPAGVEVASAAQSLGLNIDPNLGNKQAAQALSNEMALELRNPSGGAGMPGAMSDQDREFLRSMTPGIEKTPQGRQQIASSMTALAQRDQDVARLARDYRKKNGTIDEGFYEQLQQYSNSHPMFPQAKSNPIDDLVNKYKSK
jgi:hypothetical protein